MEPRYQKYKDQGYQQYLVIQTGAGFGSPPTKSLCETVRDNGGSPLTFPVLYDPLGTFAATYKGKLNEMNYVVGSGGKLVLKKQYASSTEVEATIEAELGL